MSNAVPRNMVIDFNRYLLANELDAIAYINHLDNLCVVIRRDNGTAVSEVLLERVNAEEYNAFDDDDVDTFMGWLRMMYSRVLLV